MGSYIGWNLSKTIDELIKLFEKLGYDVENKPEESHLVVSLRINLTEDSYRVFFEVRYDTLKVSTLDPLSMSEEDIRREKEARVIEIENLVYDTVAKFNETLANIDKVSNYQLKAKTKFY